MKRLLVATTGLLVLILLVYVALGCLVYGYYEPQIKLEKERQGGWNAAITEIEDECRRLRIAQNKDFVEQKRQKDRLQQAVKAEEVRLTHLEKGANDNKFRSSVEWRLRTNERLAQAQQALDEFNGSSKDTKLGDKIRSLYQRLETLRIRRDRLNLMIEWRDRLKIWPLPLIDRYVEKEEPPAEK